MCSELTPRAHVPDNRIPQLMQPWIVLYFGKIKKSKKIHTKNCRYFPLTIQECLQSPQIILNQTLAQMRFIKKFTPTDLAAKKSYTLKVRKLRQFLLTVKHPKSIDISRCLKKLTDCVKSFKKMRCFLEKLTQLAQILHKRRPRRSKWTTKNIALMIESAKKGKILTQTLGLFF